MNIRHYTSKATLTAMTSRHRTASDMDNLKLTAWSRNLTFRRTKAGTFALRRNTGIRKRFY
jgi:hypothetical protein